MNNWEEIAKKYEDRWFAANESNRQLREELERVKHDASLPRVKEVQGVYRESDLRQALAAAKEALESCHSSDVAQHYNRGKVFNALNLIAECEKGT